MTPEVSTKTQLQPYSQNQRSSFSINSGTKILFPKVLILSTSSFPDPLHSGQGLVLSQRQQQGTRVCLADCSHFLSWDKPFIQTLTSISHLAEMRKAKENCPVRKVRVRHLKLTHAMMSYPSKKFLFLFSFSFPFLLSLSPHHRFFLPSVVPCFPLFTLLFCVCILVQQMGKSPLDHVDHCGLPKRLFPAKYFIDLSLTGTISGSLSWCDNIHMF